jgi:hypothetical protein
MHVNYYIIINIFEILDFQGDNRNPKPWNIHVIVSITIQYTVYRLAFYLKHSVSET